MRRPAFGPSRTRRVSLGLECLEDRTLPSTGPVVAVDPSAYDPGRILVQFRADDSSLLGTAPVPGTRVQSALRLVPGLYAVSLDAGVGVDAALAAYRADARVLSAEPDWRIVTSQVPNDASFGQQWSLLNTGQSGGTPGADVGATRAWDVTTGSRSTVVAVLDTGIDYTHGDLYRNLWLNQGEIPASRRANLVDTDGDGLITFVDLNQPINQGPGKITDLDRNGRVDGNDVLQPMVKDVLGRDTGQGGWADSISNDGDAFVDDLVGWNFVSNTPSPYDDHGHGTHVAGTIGATPNDGFGVAGLSWSVQLMGVKFLNSSGTGTISRYVSALNYAVDHGARLSNNSWTTTSTSTTMFNAIAAAGARGHIVVAAAGNGGTNIDAAAVYPAGYSLDNVVSVAATDRNDRLAGFSNYGAQSVDLGAPGAEILSDAPGNSFSWKSGTSMAAPHVTGALALVWGQHPDWTYRQVIDRVLGTVDPLPDLQGKTVTGGRLNVAAAVGWQAPPTLPLLVTASSATGAVFNTIDTVRVTFNQPIDPASLTAADVSLRRPDGTTVAPTSVAAVAGSGNAQFEFRFPTQTAAGTYRLTVGPAIADPAGHAMPSAYTADFVIDPTVRVSSSAPVTIPSRGTATSTVTVNEDLSITRVTVRVDVTFPRDGQISLTLVAPDGTQVPLSQYRGGTGANYSGTVFDDQAAQPIAAGQAPFTGTFRPETPLSALDGHGSRGTWKLVVQNRATGFTGRITGWELTVTGRAPESAAAGSGAAAQLQILQTASLLLAVGDTPAGTPPGRNPVPFPVNVPVNRPLMLSLALLVNGAA